jgi:CubicO group peptidase (beta-lactamase class C family)
MMIRAIVLHLVCAACLVFYGSMACAQPPMPTGDPESLGFSPRWLADIDRWYQAQIDAGRLPGAVVAIARNGRIAHLRAFGYQDRDKKIPMRPDSIFWIASMTKPVTSVAAMILVEGGKLDLGAPVGRYLPELSDMKVWIERRDPATGKTEAVLVPQKHPMTVRDLLRHTAGLVYPEFGNSAVHRLYAERIVFRRDKTLTDFVASLGKLPLAHQPGEVWEYSFAADVLARIVEVASGERFDRFLESWIFKPLGMVDTGFFVPEAKLARLVAPPGSRRPALWDVTKKPNLFSGGGGLVSTAGDYLRFCQMLLNGGELDGVRILSPATVRQMTRPSLPPDIRFAGTVDGIGPVWGTSWGLGFAIRTNPDFSLIHGSVGTYTWGGLWGTRFWIDPGAKLVVVNMIQVDPATANPYGPALAYLGYAALRVPEPAPAAPAKPGVAVSPGTLASYAGTYAFGGSVSSRDRQMPTFGSIGVGLAIKDGVLTITSVGADGPAARNGMRVGDIISRIGDMPTRGITLGAAVAKMRGPVGSKLRLQITHEDDDHALELIITREPFRLPVAELAVRVAKGGLVIEATGIGPVLDFETGKPLAVQAISKSVFVVDGGDHTRIAFVANAAGKVSGAVLNPGRWEVHGARVNNR